MKLSVMELVLIVDTLNGSLCIKNGAGKLFTFTEEQRKAEMNKLQDYLNNILVSVEEENIGESSNR